MSTTTEQGRDFRLPTGSKWRAPRAVADGIGGTVIATAEVGAAPQELFDAFTTDAVEKWWRAPSYYYWSDWKADLRVTGAWRVTVKFENGATNEGFGEFAQIDAPRQVAMTRRFKEHPLQGNRETLLTYRFEAIPGGTCVTVREEGYIGRAEAAYGNAEHWERVLSWLQSYFAGVLAARPNARD